MFLSSKNNEIVSFDRKNNKQEWSILQPTIYKGKGAHFTELHDINNIPLIVAQCQIKVWLLYTRKKKPKEQSSMDNPEKLVTLDTQDDDNKTNHHYKETNTNKVNKTNNWK